MENLEEKTWYAVDRGTNKKVSINSREAALLSFFGVEVYLKDDNGEFIKEKAECSSEMMVNVA